MQVQEHDTALDQLRHRMETLPERAALRRRATGAGAELTGRLAEVQAQVDDLAGRQRQLEEQIAAAAGRRHEIEQRMLSGEVSASRDLQAMDHEVHQLAPRQAQLEEEELALLEEEEPLDALLAERPDGLRPRWRPRPTASTAASGRGRGRHQGGHRDRGGTADGLRLGLPAELAERYETLAGPPGRGGGGQAGGRPVRRLPPDPSVGGGGADPPPAARASSPPAPSATASWCTERHPDRNPGDRSLPSMLILVRHGESTGNADGLLLGRIDAPLTERGLAQARTLGPAVAGATRLISSPLARARHTAEALGTGLAIEIDDRWIEVDYGEFDGQPLGSVPAEVWTTVAIGSRLPPPRRRDAERSRAPGPGGLRRSCSPVDGAGARGPGAVVVVSHVSPIKAATCWALGLGRRGGLASLPGHRLGDPHHLGSRRAGAAPVQRDALVGAELTAGLDRGRVGQVSSRVMVAARWLLGGRAPSAAPRSAGCSSSATRWLGRGCPDHGWTRRIDGRISRAKVTLHLVGAGACRCSVQDLVEEGSGRRSRRHGVEHGGDLPRRAGAAGGRWRRCVRRQRSDRWDRVDRRSVSGGPGWLRRTPNSLVDPRNG